MPKFVLNDDDLEIIENCLRSEHIRLSSSQMTAFVADIREDVDSFRSSKKGTQRFREAHNQLQKLWKVAAKESPHRDPLVEAINGLSGEAAAHVRRRFPNVMERLLGQQPEGIDFKNWAQDAPVEILAHVSRLVTADGAEEIPGRSRGHEKRSPPRIAPIVMGVTRDRPTGVPRGGRPNNELTIDLVMRLALSWLRATGQEPKRGRSPGTGFGELVFFAFERLGLLDEEREGNDELHALRQYWTLVRTEKARRREPPPAV